MPQQTSTRDCTIVSKAYEYLHDEHMRLVADVVLNATAWRISSALVLVVGGTGGASSGTEGKQIPKLDGKDSGTEVGSETTFI